MLTILVLLAALVPCHARVNMFSYDENQDQRLQAIYDNTPPPVTNVYIENQPDVIVYPTRQLQNDLNQTMQNFQNDLYRQGYEPSTQPLLPPTWWDLNNQ